MVIIYAKKLSHIDNILWISRLARPFPATSADIKEKAKLWGFGQRTQEFLKLFPKNEVFRSRKEFLNRCEELEFLSFEKRGLLAGMSSRALH